MKFNRIQLRPASVQGLEKKNILATTEYWSCFMRTISLNGELSLILLDQSILVNFIEFISSWCSL